MVIYKLCTNDMGDMFTLTLKIKEDIEFLRGLVVKQNSGEILFWVRELNWLALLEPLKQILSDLHIFCTFSHLYNKSWETISLLGERSNSTPIISQNLLIEVISPH
jgi:hypothetical protein